MVTAKGFDGYAPIMAYIGDEGYLVNTELREGKQHCQKGILIEDGSWFVIKRKRAQNEAKGKAPQDPHSYQ